MKKQIKKKTGFTIIEVVLVLAIAGLIFLMVFVALPTLQKSQKDTQRRSGVARASTAVTNYLVNNGELPNAGASGSNFIGSYLGGSDFKDPSGNSYTMQFFGIGSGDNKGDGTAKNDYGTGSYVMTVYVGAKCDGDHASSTGAGANDYAVVYKLEGSGSYCVGNQ